MLWGSKVNLRSFGVSMSKGHFHQNCSCLFKNSLTIILKHALAWDPYICFGVKGQPGVTWDTPKAGRVRVVSTTHGSSFCCSAVDYFFRLWYAFCLTIQCKCTIRKYQNEQPALSDFVQKWQHTTYSETSKRPIHKMLTLFHFYVKYRAETIDASRIRINYSI